MILINNIKELQYNDNNNSNNNDKDNVKQQ